MSKRAIGREMDRYEIDQRIVETIVLKPNVTIDGIAKETGLSYTAVRNSLQRLLNLGVVVEAADTERQVHRGRPATYFRIDKGLQLFIPPRQFKHLALTLVNQMMKEEGPEHVEGLLDRAAKLEAERLSIEWEKEKTQLKNLKQIVQAICDYINEQGCYAEPKPFENGFYVHVNNCVYHGVSSKYPGTICRFHESLITHLAHYHDKSLIVIHEQAIAEGAHNCRYIISRR
ncbi:MAG: helix-turn-helix transcriptional regulator [Promethearchaeota archaeon]